MTNSITAIKEALNTAANRVFASETVTGMWTPPAEIVRGTQNAKTVQLPSITMSGLGTYSNGYPAGDVTISWTDVTLQNDRGRKFNLDQVDIMTQKGQADAGLVMAEFIRQKVVPECDAVNISKVAQAAVSAGNVTYGVTPAANNIFSTIVKAIRDARIGSKAQTNQGITVLVNNAYAYLLDTSSELSKSMNVSASVGRVDGEITSINGAQIKYVDEALMYQAFTLGNNGFAATDGTGKIVCLATAPDCAMAITAHQASKIIGPDDNQSADGSMIAYRAYYDCIVPTNKKVGCVVVMSTAAPSPAGEGDA